ncbi:hypothetical protein [Micromonospora endophytica]|uniref:hypothetical protein n=1 Tax=Micromonospora endophytica TaxID=515350 RepID=UPI001CB988AB|nr:hypothetical protein [Micromonospora endophytica]
MPAETALALGMTADRRPSEAMIRRLLQAMDPQLLTAAISVWLAGRAAATTSAAGRAIAVDGKGLRGSRTTDTTPATAPARWHYSASPDDFAGPWGRRAGGRSCRRADAVLRETRRRAAQRRPVARDPGRHTGRRRAWRARRCAVSGRHHRRVVFAESPLVQTAQDR